MVATSLRLLAAAFMLVALLLPQGRAKAAKTVSIPLAPASAYALGPSTFADGTFTDEGGSDEGGSCGETQEQEVVIDCGAQLERSFEEPVLVGLMRELGLEMDREACEALLRDIYAELSCEGRGPDCGQLSSGLPPAPGPKLGSSSSSARTACIDLDLGSELGNDVAPTGQRPLCSRDLQPPVPPPQ